MPSKVINMLTGVGTSELSLVPNGANDKRFALTKEKLMEFNELLKSVLETEAEGEPAFVASMQKAGISEETQQAAVAQFRLANGFADVVSKETYAVIAKAAGLEVEKALHDPEEDARRKKAKAEADAKAKAKADDDDPGSGNPFGKEAAALRKEYDEKLAKADEAREKLEKQMADMQRTALRKELVIECEKEFAHVPGKSFDEMADMLLEARGVSESFEKSLREQWAATAETVKKSAMFATAGVTSRGGGSSAETALEQIAKELVKADPKLSYAKAYDRIIVEHPELYQQYLAENPAQTQR